MDIGDVFIKKKYWERFLNMAFVRKQNKSGSRCVFAEVMDR